MKQGHLAIVVFFLMTACKQPVETPAEQIPQIQEIGLPVSGNSHLGRLKATEEALYFSWVQSSDKVDTLFYSSFKEGKWQEPIYVAHSTDWFVNWADFPAIAANGDKVLSNVLAKSDTGTYTYDIRLNLLDKDAISKLDFILHTDGTKSEHGFVSLLPWKEGFFATWLDGRNTAGGHGGHDGHSTAGAMTLRGAFIGPEGHIIGDTELDARICDCCQTAAALFPDGLLVAYRDRTEEEIRDISVVKYTTEEGWSSPMAVSGDNWEIAGCPVNGPSLSSLDKQVALAWFTAAAGEGKVNLKISKDGAETFGPAIRLDGGFATGRVDVEWLDSNRLAVLWMEPLEEMDGLVLKILNTEGEVLEHHIMATIDASRASGFPQLERLGTDLYISWTDVGAEGIGAKIRMKRLAITP